MRAFPIVPDVSGHMYVMIGKLMLVEAIDFLLTFSDDVHGYPVIKAYPLHYFEADVALTKEAVDWPALVINHHLLVLQ